MPRELSAEEQEDLKRLEQQLRGAAKEHLLLEEDLRKNSHKMTIPEINMAKDQIKKKRSEMNRIKNKFVKAGGEFGEYGFENLRNSLKGAA